MAMTGALQIVDAAVAGYDAVVGEAGFLELSVHVAGENECTVLLAVSPLFKEMEALMWLGVAVAVEPPAIEAPGQMRTH